MQHGRFGVSGCGSASGQGVIKKRFEAEEGGGKNIDVSGEIQGNDQHFDIELYSKTQEMIKNKKNSNSAVR